MPDINPLSPMEMQVQQQAIDRQRKIAEYLQQQSLTPDQGQMVSGRYVAPSATQYLARLAQGLLGRSQQSSLDDKQMGLAKQYSDSLNGLAQQLVNGGQPAAQPAASAPAAAASSPAVANSPVVLPSDDGSQATFKSAPQYIGASSPDAPATAPSAPPQSGGNPMFKGVSPQLVANFLMNKDSSFGKIAEMQIQANLKNAEPTELIKTLTAAGIDPKSAQGQQILNANISKTNYIAPASLRPGGIAAFADGRMEQMPTAIEGAQAIKMPDGTWSYRQNAGALPAIAAARAAIKSGENQQTLAPPNMSPTLPNGQVVPTTVAATINGGQGAAQPATTVSPADQRTRDQEALTIAQSDIANATTPQDKAQATQAYNTMLARFNAGQSVITGSAKAPQGVGPAFGQEAGATNAQTELSKKFSDLQQQNSQAQITSSYLQNIKQQAQKAAVGPMSDKIDFVNGLLSLAGSEKATNAVTANDLLNKYSNQIVSRLGTGGLGTDAARAIIQSAYPNAHMNIGAINEASDNLIGASDMIKAKMSLLSPHGNSRDPVAYQQKEQVFDQNADPRIWQYKNLGPGTQQGKAFLQGVIKQDPSFIQKIQSLEKIGAL